MKADMLVENRMQDLENKSLECYAFKCRAEGNLSGRDDEVKTQFLAEINSKYLPK
jgi:hypothetical protein